MKTELSTENTLNVFNGAQRNNDCTANEYIDIEKARAEVAALQAEIKKLDAENTAYAALVADLREHIDEMIWDEK